MAVTIAGDLVLWPEQTPSRGWIRVDDGVMTEVGEGRSDDPMAVRAEVIAPGFIDIHCHGGGRAEFTSADDEQIERAIATHRRHGTTTMNASLVSATYDDLERQIRALIPHVDDGSLHGIHLEGPWISEHYCGAHDPKTLRAPDPDEVARILDVGHGRIAMVTIAPELPGAVDSIRRIADAGAVAAVGHTAADADATRAAIDAGATVATHLFNAMPPLLHRAAGPVGALLSDERVWPEIICDGIHVEPDVVDLALAAAEGRGVLITDAMAAAGAEDGDYRIGNLDVQVRDGAARLASNGALAGSTLTMDKAVRRTVTLAGRSLASAAKAATATPAAVLGLGDRGSLAVGQRADLVLLDDDLEVERVMRGGDWVIRPH
ncbi:MAG: N-acetylglucosamine-6-phosphate deacetylase [Candidatus Nanopelagicales bacterium]|jgi:N-acetylglucosamine-6-phosphate deacetylase